MAALSSDVIARCFLAACNAELTALKPGNVHIHAPGHGMDVTHFKAAAEACAPIIGLSGLTLGLRIKNAVASSMAAAGCNTNLGIILLCAPIAAAAMRNEPVSLFERVKCELAELRPNDAGFVYAAIRQANPGGLGTTEEADVAQSPTIPLLDAMALAAPRDRIAANYVSGLRDIFEDHLPLLIQISGDTSSNNGIPPSRDDAVATLYMSLLARYPDSHIRRKFGMETSAHVQRLAQAGRACWTPFVQSASYAELMALDRILKTERWNPGTTADFVVATLFAAALEDQFHH